MRIYLIDGLFEVRARNEQSARNKAEKKLRFAIRTIVDVTDENQNEDISFAAAALGRKGGSSTSKAKRKSSAENGKLGGRPKSKDKDAN